MRGPGVVGLALALGAAQIGADDMERLRALRAAGDILPLTRILAALRTADPQARVVEAELEFEHGRWVYEIEFLDGGQRLREVYFDARTGQRID